MRPVIYGEVLFDIFPDGTAVLGGAPFNVAWHLQGFGLEPLFVSRVGQDKLGDQILNKMDDWGMDTYAVTQDPDAETGQVKITLQDGQPEFDILPDVAFDHIPATGLEKLYNNQSYGTLYHGSLIYRMPKSADSLRLLRKAAPSIFVDINLRAPWWGKSQLEELIQGINWLKINDSELQEITGKSIENDQEVEQSARDMLKQYNLEAIIITRGAKGASLITAENTRHVAPAKIKRLVDTVGAGDGFSSVWLTGILKGWPEELILERAVAFAAAICQLRGAVSQDKEFYRQYRNLWNL
ncbi:MAG: carbohydrate kinase [Thiohalophilus sp.]|jgi:fructokinase